jgi:hypothetical protein
MINPLFTRVLGKMDAEASALVAKKAASLS